MTASCGFVLRPDLDAVQAALRADGLDSWLLHDFTALGGYLATRRWCYQIRANAEPRGLVDAIDSILATRK